MNDASAKQQIAEKIKANTNILVTVSTNPSVDELSAALGLTVLLNKLNKHATAVFSGDIPPAITFLEPDRTFEQTVDSLRDFIIALDKEKADHLRYKVDGDVVKIFITPYRTTITSADLEFSQGDYNVELVLGLGVKNQDHLDTALSAHGRILHDADVMTITAGDETSDLGTVDWHESGASSLSEMLVSLSEALKTDKPLLDEQIATAFLTGIVAATDRFSNNHTSSRVMTMAAQLMAAGANQQLIAAKLEEAHEIGEDKTSSQASEATNADGTTDLSEGTSTKLKKSSKKAAQKDKPKDDGSLAISHEPEGSVDEVAQTVEAEQQAAATALAEDKLDEVARETSETAQAEAEVAAEQDLAQHLADVKSAAPSVSDLQKDIAQASAELDQPAPITAPLRGAVPREAWSAPETPGIPEPSFGGTLNATTEQAAEDTRRDLEEDRNRTILSHQAEAEGGQDYLVGQATAVASTPPVITPPSEAYAAAHPLPPLPPIETLAQIDEEARGGEHQEARDAISAAYQNAPMAPNPFIETPIPASQVPPQAAPEPVVPTPVPDLPPLPPLPDFSTLPPMPGPTPPTNLEAEAPQIPVDTPFIPTPPQPPADPGQFRIPGQS